MSLRARSRMTSLALLISLHSVGCDQDKTYFRSLDGTGGGPPETADAAPKYLKTFEAGQLQTADIKIDSGFRLISQDIDLVRAPVSAELSQQIDRKIFEDKFTQGHSGFSKQESFAISEAGIFDLLMVMDNSSSMGPYQTRMAKNLPSILKYISNTNWRIAVVTTSSPCLNSTSDGRRYISRADYDADPAKATADFQTLIRIGEGGDPVEKGIKMAADAMIGAGCSKASNEWLRADSQRSILVITDEKNCGSGSNEGCTGASYASAQYFFDRVGYNVPVNAFLLLEEPPMANPSDPSDPNHDCENSGGYLQAPNPSEYLRMVNATGGISVDVCRSDYKAVLEQISLNVRKKINIQFELSNPAIASSLDLKIDGQSIKDFASSGRTLTILQNVGERAQRLHVSYKYDAKPLLQTFRLSNPHDTQSMEVYVDGERLNKDAYTYSPGGRSIEMRNLPKEMAEIKLRYRDALPLRSIFNYRENFVPGSLEVWVDDKKIENFEHDSDLKKVTITPPPADGQSISLRYEMPNDRQLSYPILGADPSRIENFRLFELASGEELPANVDGSQLLLDRASIINGRKVRAVYNMNYDFKDKVYDVAIQDLPFPDTLKIIAEGGDSNVCNQGVEVHADRINFSCQDEDFESLAVQYQYAAGYKNSFDISVDYSGPKLYEVFINDQPTTAYHLVGDRLVILKKDLIPGSIVKVLISAR